VKKGYGQGYGRRPLRVGQDKESSMNESVIVIHPADNVGVVIREIKAGETFVGAGGTSITATDDIPKNHKIALVDIPANAPVVKYGEEIGRAREVIRAGRWVHTHNLKTKEG
jgi:altronate hydrolase